MSVEQIARDFITSMNDVNAAEAYLTPDAVAAGGVLPQPIPAKEAISLMSALNTAFPDLKFDIQNVTINGNQATVQAVWSGTNNGDLNMPGMPSIPATGKNVSVKDTYIVTVEGDKVSRLDVDSASPPRWVRSASKYRECSSNYISTTHERRPSYVSTRKYRHSPSPL